MGRRRKNLTVEQNALVEGASAQAPYDIIFVEGGTEEASQALRSQKIMLWLRADAWSQCFGKVRKAERIFSFGKKGGSVRARVRFRRFDCLAGHGSWCPCETNPQFDAARWTGFGD